jgi:hypothetical protein
VLGQPVATEPEIVGDASQGPGRGERLTRGLAAAHGHEVEHGQSG